MDPRMEHIEQMLRKLFGEIAKEHHYADYTLQLNAISSDGANYSSVLYTATISSLNKEDLHLFAKVAAVGEDLRAMASDVDLFDIEYFIYSDMAMKFKQIEDKYEVHKKDRFTFCKYYGYNANKYEETLVLENLAAKGFIVYDRMKSIDWQYASKAVESLAKFHALSMVYCELYPEGYTRLCEKFSIMEQGYKAMGVTMKKFVGMAINATKPEKKDKVTRFFDNEVNLNLLHYTKPRRKGVLIHGDYRPSNLMHKLNEMLRKLFIEIANRHHYANCSLQLKAISSGGANYTSELYTATVSSPNKEDLQLFAKVAVVGEKIRAMIPNGVFDTEYFVYSELAEKFKQIEDKHGVSKEDSYSFCKYYGYNPNLYEEVLVLENLAAKGFIVYDRLKSVDWIYASNAVKTLAKFHSLSIAYGEQYPEKIKELSENYAKLEAGFELMIITCKKMLTVALKQTKPENKDRLAKFFSNEDNYDMTHYTKPRRKAVIIHGDYRPSNLMHKVTEDGTVQVVPLDFQTIRPGCIVADLLYFIFSSSDQEFRAQYYEQLVECYYQQLCRSLRALHFDPEEMYSKEDFQAELKEILPYGLIVSIMLLPVITVEPKDAPDIHVDNIFESMANTKTSSLYPDRLNGVVDDYVKWGII